jgi:hypothetical protein
MQLYHEYRLKIQMARKVKGVIFFNDNFEITKRDPVDYSILVL